MGEMKTVVVEMKQNMDNVVFLINEIKYTFPIPETIKNFLRFGFLNNKIFFKMFLFFFLFVENFVEEGQNTPQVPHCHSTISFVLCTAVIYGTPFFYPYIYRPFFYWITRADFVLGSISIRQSKALIRDAFTVAVVGVEKLIRQVIGLFCVLTPLNSTSLLWIVCVFTA